MSRKGVIKLHANCQKPISLRTYHRKYTDWKCGTEGEASVMMSFCCNVKGSVQLPNRHRKSREMIPE
jgi:hypothetical protein